jgi:hypothetical protein
MQQNDVPGRPATSGPQGPGPNARGGLTVTVETQQSLLPVAAANRQAACSKLTG